VHNYQLPEVQDIADDVGDSLGIRIQDAAVVMAHPECSRGVRALADRVLFTEAKQCIRRMLEYRV